jgi:hypothetical protein
MKLGFVSSASCAHCGKNGGGFKRCSICKEASYCGAACQHANWKRHKKTCKPPLSLSDVLVKVSDAVVAKDWRGLLKFEGRMEEMMALISDASREKVLAAFSWAHQEGRRATGRNDHRLAIVSLEERRIPLLGNLQRFLDQGEAMCEIAGSLLKLVRGADAARWFERARDVGAAHGFFSLESTACWGLGKLAMVGGRHEEGLALLRNALVAAELNELDDPAYELDAMGSLIPALFKTRAIDEADPLVARYREAAKAYSEKKGGFCELRSLFYSARLHEVLCVCTPRWEPLLSHPAYTKDELLLFFTG